MGTIDSKAWDGVQSLLDGYVKISADDYVVLLYTSDSSEWAALVSVALDLRGIPYKRVWMAPLWDGGFLARLAPALPDPAELSGRLVVLSFERDTMSHTLELIDAIEPYKNKISFRAISACPSLFSIALHASPEELSARNTALLERLMPAKRLHITTEGGSDLEVTLDTKHRWISNRGMARPGAIAILPAGEVATFPASISGKLVADFAFNVNAITRRDARLQDHPVTIWVEGGRAVKAECADLAVSKFIDECFSTHCSYNVGELGFGTNFAVTDAIPLNSHINERRPGVHLGFGNHNQHFDVVSYKCLVHLDLITRGAMVWVDEDEAPINLENIVPSAGQHPNSTRDEDVFQGGTRLTSELEIDDCCGLLTLNGGFRLFSQAGVGSGSSISLEAPARAE
jgi:Thermophilic metalloprotease (M29)